MSEFDYSRLVAPMGMSFHPNDALEIRRIARAKLNSGLEGEAVLADFHATGYWGFTPVKQPAPIAPQTAGNTLGVRLIVISFITATFGIMSVVWLGQNYAISGESSDFVKLLLAIGSVLAMYVIFLWTARKRE